MEQPPSSGEEEEEEEEEEGGGPPTGLRPDVETSSFSSGEQTLVLGAKTNRIQKRIDKEGLKKKVTSPLLALQVR